MKINRAYSVNASIVEPKEVDQSGEIGTKAPLKTPDQLKISQGDVNTVQTGYKATYPLQENISILQQKVSVLKIFGETKDQTIIDQSVFNGKNLFSLDERNKLFKAPADISSLIAGYEKTIGDIRTNLTESMVSISNSSAVMTEKDMQSVIKRIADSMPDGFKTNTVVNALDLLK